MQSSYNSKGPFNFYLESRTIVIKGIWFGHPKLHVYLDVVKYHLHVVKLVKNNYLTVILWTNKQT